ncbi:MAG: GNAT family N-acetyltransferase [Acidimicrobiales bacterium]
MTRPVDPADRHAFAEWFAVVDAGGRERWPGRPGWQPDELRAPALDPQGAVRTVLLAEGDPVVGAGMVELPRHDNRHLAQVTVEVHPAHRRRGVGSAVLAACERLAAGDGRRVVWGNDELQVPAVPGPTFAEARGYGLVLENLRRELAVPVDPARARRLEALALARAAGYEVVAFAGRWPDGWVEDRALFGRLMSTDPPLGGWAVEEESWDRDRVRRHERLVDRTGRELLVAVARHRATGRPVAFTEIAVSRSAPALAYQWDTLVLPEHRGRRLGLLVKLANLRQLAEISPGTEVVVTWNASTNRPMIDVNEALGCRVVSVGRTWQKAFGSA